MAGQALTRQAYYDITQTRILQKVQKSREILQRFTPALAFLWTD